MEQGKLKDFYNLLTNNGKIQYSGIQDFSTFISRYEYFKKYIHECVPELSKEEILKFYKNYNQFRDIFKMSNFETFFDAIEYEDTNK